MVNHNRVQMEPQTEERWTPRQPQWPLDGEQEIWHEGPEWEVLPDGHTYRCRSQHCPNPAVARLNRTKRWSARQTPNWWAYCHEHMYGRWIEAGQVVSWRVKHDLVPA